MATWRAGVATDSGKQRSSNEDRVFADDSHGIFLVVDGMGGHAAGEIAAETALDSVRANLSGLDSDRDVEDQVRAAITAANNAVRRLSEQKSEYGGMACVLTLAVAHSDHVTVGHVGDSRLYLAWNGELRKLTSDHSPVGEQEDNGEISEEEAMNHPRRNEVYRDIGSEWHNLDDTNFIETKTLLFRTDAALLLCSDGLSDTLTAAQISAVIERYEGDPSKVALQLVDAANRAGGKDNISVIFVPGPEFIGSNAASVAAARQRHAVTRIRPKARRWRSVVRTLVLLVVGMFLGIALWLGVQRFWH
ncbi:MAG TPA: protein phosphatase 2C domain-containing protein [Bryobacteraceae bacterium]|nr:protein phosphatase 2C domain-containing protein [Bryobacteraceae bacterium]